MASLKLCLCLPKIMLLLFALGKRVEILKCSKVLGTSLRVSYTIEMRESFFLEHLSFLLLVVLSACLMIPNWQPWAL